MRMIVKHLSKQFSVPDEMSADFAHWGDMPHWTAGEVTALALGVDPEKCFRLEIALEVSGVQRPVWQIQLLEVYTRLRTRLRRAVEIGELGSTPWVGGEGELIYPPLSRAAWVKWLAQNEIALPQELVTHVRELQNSRKNMTCPSGRYHPN